MVPSHFPTHPKRPLPYDTLPGALPGPPSRWHCALGWPWPPAVPRPRRKGRPKGRHRGWTPFESSWDRADFWGFENWKSAASRLRYGAMQGLRMQLGYRKVWSDQSESNWKGPIIMSLARYSLSWQPALHGRKFDHRHPSGAPISSQGSRLGWRQKKGPLLLCFFERYPFARWV